MRLKEDSSSYNSSNVKRRLYRQSPVIARGKLRNKKNTKKWCKGKIGVPHNYVDVKETKFYNISWITSTCTNCGKKDFSTTRLEDRRPRLF